MLSFDSLNLSSKMIHAANYPISHRHILPVSKAFPSQDRDHRFDFNQVAFKRPVAKEIESETINALTKLTSAEQYRKIGTNVIQREQEMIGTLLDVHI